MKLIGLMLVSTLFAGTVASDPGLRANMTSLHTTQCRRSHEVSEVNLSGRFEVLNSSSETILLPKTTDLVLSVSAASSYENSKQGKFEFQMNQEFGVAKAVDPRLEDFI